MSADEMDRVVSAGNGGWLRTCARLAPWLAAALLVALAVWRLQAFYPTGFGPDVNSDAYWTYLPAARAWLAHGWGFLLHDPLSVRVAPLGYLWPSLWGADVAAIRWANGGLFVLALLLLVQTGRRLGGWSGAVAAAALLLCNNAIVANMPRVLGEPLYLLGLALMSWALVEILLRLDAARWAWYATAALGLTITLLTRPVLQLMVLAALVLLALALVAMAAVPRLHQRLGACRSVLRRAVVMLLVASLLPLAVVLKNGVQFDVWGLGTGAGAGLYYGVNPLRLGHEPAFMGFSYDLGDVNATADARTRGEPLDPLADRIERAAGVSVLAQTRPADLARFLALKLRSWLFYGTPELVLDPRLRLLRLFEWLCLAAAAWSLLWQRWRPTSTSRRAPAAEDEVGPVLLAPRRRVVVVLLALGLAALVLQLLPLLYNTRYNAGFLEPWLILLTAAALGRLLSAWRVRGARHVRRLRQALLVAALFAVAQALAAHAARHETLPLNPLRLGPVAQVLGPSAFGAATVNAQPLAGGGWRMQARVTVLQVPMHAAPGQTFPSMDFLDGVWRLRLRVSAARPASCRRADMQLQHPAGAEGFPPPVIPLLADGRWHTYAIFGNGALRPTRPGWLEIRFACPAGTELQWGGAQLLRSTMSQAVRALWRDGTPIDPYTPLPWPAGATPAAAAPASGAVHPEPAG